MYADRTQIRAAFSLWNEYLGGTMSLATVRIYAEVALRDGNDMECATLLSLIAGY